MEPSNDRDLHLVRRLELDGEVYDDLRAVLVATA